MLQSNKEVSAIRTDVKQNNNGLQAQFLWQNDGEEMFYTKKVL